MRNPFPVFLKTVHIVAPASLLSPSSVLGPTLELLPTLGIENIFVGPHVFDGAPQSYLSAPDPLRLSDINAAFSWVAESGNNTAPQTDLVWCIRGGYGTMRILDQIQFTDKALLGYSDITALLLGMYVQQVGTPIAGVHADRFAARFADAPLTMDSLAWALQPAPKDDYFLPTDKLRFVKQGTKPTVSGPIIPVNLSIFCSLLGSPYIPDMRGKVLLIEDVDEPLRKIDRMLAQLRLSGVLSQVAGLLFGQYVGEVYPEELAKEYSEYVNGPVVMGIPFGHEVGSLSIPVGAECVIENKTVRLRG